MLKVCLFPPPKTSNEENSVFKVIFSSSLLDDLVMRRKHDKEEGELAWCLEAFSGIGLLPLLVLIVGFPVNMA